MTRKRRLLVVAADLGGGTGAHVRMLLRELMALGWSVRVLCHGSIDIQLPEGVEWEPPPPPGGWNRFPFAQLRQVRHLRRVVRAWKPDVVQTYFFWSVMYGRVLRRPGTVTCLVENREDEGFNLSNVAFRMLRLSRTIPDRVICVSEAVRRVTETREGLSSEQLEAIRNGVEIPKATVPAKTLTALRSEFGIEEGQPVVGLVANLNRPIKGVEYFVQAVPGILGRCPDARFLIFGDGYLREELEALARTLGVSEQLHFAGFRRDILSCYPLFSVSALTSLSEGLSITILESMAFGVPVVATWVGGNPELVQEGRTGLLVPPREVEAFADAVSELLRDPARAQAMGEAARETVSAFSIRAVAAAYDRSYREVLSSSTCRRASR